ncbi:MAG: low temperature requirement protein, partial [Microbacteriaceae bacterium]|nr:low temperature requirement protein [Microbacteriaceae bacterium]
MPSLPRIRSRMRGRDIRQEDRASTPLELLFDLTFVVAVAQVAGQLAHAISHGMTLVSILPYVMVFFAIWWAWINFTWFASAFDTDDVPYRLLTMLQMGGVLVLAAGVHGAFTSSNFVTMTVGYVIMRVAMVAQWGRVIAQDPASRPMAIRYVFGVASIQVLWVLRLLVPGEFGIVSFLVLALLEGLVPVFAEHKNLSPWHAGHIAERYGLFVIILLGECVSATTIAVQGIVTAHGVTANLLLVGIAGLVLLFALWWLYFMGDTRDRLRDRRERSFIWAYGHYFVFASIAAIGAGIEVAVEEPAAVPRIVIAYALAVPVAIFVIALIAVNRWLGVTGASRPVPAIA